MTDHPRGKAGQMLAAAVFVLLVGGVCQWVFGEDIQYILDDASMSGRDIISFDDGDSHVSVVLGEFKLTVGRREITGRDAVVWIADHKVGNVIQRDITVYVEGNAKVVEPNATSIIDKTILVTVHHQGELNVDGNLSVSSLKNDPFYRRALAVRTGKPVPVETPTSAPAAAPAILLPARSIQSPLKVAATTRPSPGPKVIHPVLFSAQNPVTYEETAPNKHVAVASGDVRLSQGEASSDQFLQLSAQGAVIFTEMQPEKDKASAHAPQIIGLGVGGAGGAKEGISGVYLEGDVIISRGERTMRAPAAYYDFANERAIIVEPVFRTIQMQRNIPIYIRAKEARVLSAKEVFFRDAKVTTSDFHSPEYHIGASSVLLKDVTPYDEEGNRLADPTYHTEMHDVTANVRTLPLFYWPYTEGDLQEEPTALRRISVGSEHDLGFGLQTEWDLFRLLGLLGPKGYKARLDFEVYEHGVLAGVNVKYARQLAARQYSGYWKFYGLIDSQHVDTFGRDREEVAPTDRGRVLMRHKEFLPQDLELQFELSYLSDRGFLEKFFPNEFYAGKEQETLFYAKKQRDNWALTSLIKFRVNDFQTQSESYPDLGFNLIGEPLLGDRLTFFSENHAGIERYRPDEALFLEPGSSVMGRADTRDEVDWPLHLGPMNLVPFATGRASGWTDKPQDVTKPDVGENARPWGQAGLKTNTHVWRVYNDADSRLWDVHRLKHIITPEAAAFISDDGGVSPDDLFPLDPGIEQHVGRVDGGTVGVYQRLQTKRGPAGQQHTVDWMTLNVIASFFNTDLATPPADGRYFMSRPELSIPRDSINGEYTWSISDATMFLADTNYDTKTNKTGRADAGFAVQRDPRIRYYLGWRYIGELDTSVGTFGLNYKLNRKYSFSFFQQYDFLYDNGTNLATNISVIRKFPRWYGAFTFGFDQRTNDVSVFLTFWPEGVPEARLSSGRMSVLGASSEN